MKKVMLLIHAMTTGGAETLVKDYALKLDKLKYEVVVLCFYHSKESPYEKILNDNNIRTIYVDKNKISTNNIFKKLILFIHRYLSIRKIIRSESPDVLHTHLNLNSYVFFSSVSKKCRLIHTVHNEPSVLWGKSMKDRIDLFCAKYLVKHKKMRFIVLHEEMRKEVNKIFKVSNSIVLNNGIDFKRFDKKNIKNSNELKKELNIPIDSFVIGHIGRFNKQKNQSFLVDIFYQIAKNNDKAFLLLIGDGNEKKEIINKINHLELNNRCIILSNRKDIPDLLGVMNSFVFPSIYEGLGIVLIEAQKMGVPCFISNAVPKAAVVSNLVTTISLDKEAKEWADIINNYKQPKNIESNMDMWDMDKVIDKLEKIYENII